MVAYLRNYETSELRKWGRSMKEWLEKLKNGKKDQILILLLTGILLVVIAWPSDNGASDEKETGARTEKEDGTAGEEAEAEMGNGSTIIGSADESFTLALETRLKQILSQVDGVGDVEVMITLKSSGRKVVEKDTEQSEAKEESTNESESASSEQSSNGESTIYEKDSDGNEIPYVTEALAPEILGVLVIAQGAGSQTVVTEITEAVMALFGVEAHKIKVMKME
ncbi:MAG: stage III sporulation protein AG [Lachnospiraceae bacterium]|nr:stage III sporulation protein AG [Lachnospiraceae bacterium]